MSMFDVIVVGHGEPVGTEVFISVLAAGAVHTAVRDTTDSNFIANLEKIINCKKALKRVGPYVRPYVKLGMLDLSYRFQTLHGDSFSS